MTSSSASSSTRPSQVVVDAGIFVRAFVAHPLQPIVLAQMLTWAQTNTALYAPTLWRYELTSVLTKLTHFAQINEREADSILQKVLEVDIQLIIPDETLVRSAFKWTRKLKRAAAYDSFYLALAQQLGCELWTVDSTLYNAANVPWVRLIS